MRIASDIGISVVTAKWWQTAQKQTNHLVDDGDDLPLTIYNEELGGVDSSAIKDEPFQLLNWSSGKTLRRSSECSKQNCI